MHNEIIKLKQKVLNSKQAIATLTETIQKDYLDLNAIIRRNKKKSSEIARVSLQNFSEYLAKCEDRYVTLIVSVH